MRRVFLAVMRARARCSACDARFDTWGLVDVDMRRSEIAVCIQIFLGIERGFSKVILEIFELVVVVWLLLL